jgi:hypothetical protein
VGLNKLVKRFRRELVGSPKKAAVLGLLAVAGLYFWGPLLWGWIAKDNSATGASPAVPAAVAVVGPSLPQSVSGQAAPEKIEIPWQQLIQLIEHDPRTGAANLATDMRNPFAPPPSKRVVEQKAPPPKATPQSAGLELAGTILGPNRRVARISGKTYREGQTIEVSKDGQALAFTLVEVHPKHVVLTRQGEKFELAIVGRTPSGHVEMTKNGN